MSIVGTYARMLQKFKDLNFSVLELKIICENREKTVFLLKKITKGSLLTFKYLLKSLDLHYGTSINYVTLKGEAQRFVTNLFKSIGICTVFCYERGGF
jgi:hypothetical protein